MFFFTPYNHVLAERSDLSVAPHDPVSLTVQSQAEDCDLNVLMKRFGVTGKLPDNGRVPTYGDFTGITDFRTAIHAIRDAQDAFNEWPAEVRARFDNDPQLMLEFASDPRNKGMFKEIFGDKLSKSVGGSVASVAGGSGGGKAGDVGSGPGGSAGGAPPVKLAGGEADKQLPAGA